MLKDENKSKGCATKKEAMKKNFTRSNLSSKVGKCISFITLLISFALSNLSAQTFTPRHYWTFDSSAPLRDSMGNSNLDPNYFQGTYSIASGNAGKCLRLGNGGKDIVASNSFTPDSLLTIEFLFKN